MKTTFLLEYYKHRGNVFYFRDITLARKHKISLELNGEAAKELRQIKMGILFDFHITINYTGVTMELKEAAKKYRSIPRQLSIDRIGEQL
jgi:hypothetical protein